MRARQSLLALILCAAPALVATTAAHADEFWTMDGGIFCYAEDAGGAGQVSSGTVDGHYVITNWTSTSVKIYCGIIRSTSGPGISSDVLVAVDATFTHPESVGSSCGVNVWSMSANAGTNGPTLVETQSSVTIPGPGTFAVYRKKMGSAKNYWGTDNGGTWKYAQLGCTLTPHATLAYYSVQERGTNQSRFIYSAPQVQPNSTSFSGSYNHCIIPGPGGDYGGCFEGVGSFPMGFTVPLMVFPNGNAHVQVMVSPSISGYAFTTMKCTFQAQNTTLLAPLNGSPGSPQPWPGKVLSFTRNNPWNQDVINCGTFEAGGNPIVPAGGPADASGDGKYFSYRTF